MPGPVSGRPVIRAEAIARILRWRDVLVGAAATGLGLWWALTAFGVLRWVGVAVALGGGAVLLEAARRLRRPRGGGGAGIVSVTERQITYLSGHGGGAVSLDGLRRVSVLRDGGAPRWRLFDGDGHGLDIPADAENAEAIFDALIALPGLAEPDAVAALTEARSGETVVWEAGAKRLG
ncbi:hypothetical protein [Palleronia rufa]|uniref:hypothetical protein n=1 Tax=Palleronia rufa TaxID=1530186 RepID=UPI000690738E